MNHHDSQKAEGPSAQAASGSGMNLDQVGGGPQVVAGEAASDDGNLGVKTSMHLACAI